MQLASVPTSAWVSDVPPSGLQRDTPHRPVATPHSAENSRLSLMRRNHSAEMVSRILASGPDWRHGGPAELWRIKRTRGTAPWGGPVT